MSLKRSIPATLQKPVLAMPVRPLGFADLKVVEQALADVASDWSVELDGVSLREASLVVLPDSGDDAMGPGFIISREDFGFRLDQLHWDVMQEIGSYAILSEAIAAVCAQLLFSAGRTYPRSLTLH